MNKLPTKQIYLLFIIIVGIIALSVYSTYALFTFENETSDIVSIHIPKSLTISENIYEYQQVALEPNSVATTDIDIYNSFDYEVCYSVWYKVIGEIELQNKVQIFEQNEGTLTSSGLLSGNTHIRVKLVIINDNDTKIKINLGTIGTQKKEGTCSLNITNDKNVVSTAYKNIDILTDKLLENKEPTIIEEGYLTYKDITDVIKYNESDSIYTAYDFTYNNELFTLTDAKYINFKELLDENRLLSKDIYFCKNGETCNILYRFRLENIEIKTEDNTNSDYLINKHDKLIGYQKGEIGLRKINDTDYMYYGDNPNNFIYYNCTNNDDLSTCELWRILGFFYDKQKQKYITKIVRNDSIGKYQYDYKITNNINESSNDWNSSTLLKYLNEEYKIINNNDIYLENYLQKLEIIPSLEVDIEKMQTENTDDSKIKILSLSDYLNTSSCKNSQINEYNEICFINNWLNNIEIEKEWTNTAKEVIILEEIEIDTPLEDDVIVPGENEIVTEDESNNEDKNDSLESTEPIEENKYIINYVYTIGKNITENDVNDTLDVRPVVFLKERILLLDGNGSFENPYVVK